MKKNLLNALIILFLIGTAFGIVHIVNANKVESSSKMSGISLPQSFTPNENQVCFYENDNYGGAYICLSSSGEYVDLGRFYVGTSTTRNWHDKISSVIIGAKACAIMYEHPNGGGYCLILYGNGTEARYFPKLSDYKFNDKASHIKSKAYPENLPREPASNQVVLFEHTNFDGLGLVLAADKDEPNLSTYSFAGGQNWNDKISSLKIGKEACLTVWNDSNYKGTKTIWDGDGYSVTKGPDLHPAGLGDKITSLKVRPRNVCAY